MNIPVSVVVARCYCFYDRSMPTLLLLLASFDCYSGAAPILKIRNNVAHAYNDGEQLIVVANVVIVGEQVGHKHGPKLLLLTVAS